jgi:hypothetical protein
VLDLAAGLTELTASLAGDDALAARATALGTRARELGALDADAYEALLRTGEDEARERTIDAPVLLGEAAAEIAELAAQAAGSSGRDWRYDAVAGAVLAAAAADVAALLVEANLRGREDARAPRARTSARRAGLSARRARSR